MNYLINSRYGSLLYQTSGIVELSMSSSTFVKQLCHAHLFTLSGYLQACQQTFGYRYKIPLYLSKKLALFPTKNWREIDTVWINQKNVRHFKAKGQQTELTFFNQEKLIIDLSYGKVQEQIQRLETIEKYKVNIFIRPMIEKHFK